MPRDILGRMRYVSLFSGIEAASVAWEPLGWGPGAFRGIGPFPLRGSLSAGSRSRSAR